MALQPGARLGGYEILSPLGAGGMGEVYRARDTRLKRDVAIKVLPETLSADPDRLARFQREAELLATLNHPNIAAIYGLEDAGGASAIVMELVEGETLADKLWGIVGTGLGRQETPRPVPLDDALAVARQIADALEAAHDRGVIHRDLKPANIKITPDGKVKVLDFGLAKDMGTGVGRGSTPTPVPISLSPTLSIHATNAGVILGTAAYMSPEQARAKPVDRRTDIWAFGCVLFEMLTGRQAFAGETITDVLSAITRDEPDWTALPADTPPHIRTLLRRCLQKDPQKRLPHIGIARIEIDEGPPAGVPAVAQGFSPAEPVRKSRAMLPWIVAAVLGVALIAVIARWAPWRAAVRPPLVRVSAEIGVDASLANDLGASVALSSDGTLLAFVARKGAGGTQLYLRHVDRLDATVLTGADNAEFPFFSPDGRWIAFFADSKLKKISVTGGAAVTLCDAPNGRGGSWADDGTIVFQPNVTGTGRGLMRVSDGGGTPQTLTTLQEGEANQRWPQMLPGGKAVLYTAAVSAGSYGDANISVQLAPGGTRKILVRGGFFGHYLSSGHLLYLHDGTLFAVPFDLDRLELTGQAVPVLERVATNTTVGAADFDVSNAGTLVYVNGALFTSALPMTWLSRDHKTAALRAAPSDWSNPRFSPDGRQLAMDLAGPPQQDVWLYSWERDAASRLTVDPGNHAYPLWTPDGRRLVFRAQPTNASVFNLFWQRADGAGAAERLTTSPNLQYPGSWHPSGKFLAFTENSAQTNFDLMILPMDGDDTTGWKPGKPYAFLSTPSSEIDPMFSPDGRWIAYQSAETGRPEIFVSPFPGPGGKWQVSTDGATFATWSHTRKELFFLAPDGRILVAPYTVEGDSFKADRPKVWSDVRLAPRPRGTTGSGGRSFDLHPDGDRFVVALAPQTQEDIKQDKVVFVFNFFDELRRLAPPGRR